MRAAVFGAGAMGCALGAYVARAGAPIDLVSRNRAHVEALNRRGAHVGGTVDFVAKVRAILPEEMTGGYDMIFLCAKQTENAQIAPFLAERLSERGAVCTIQNGLPEYGLAEVLGGERVLGCACSWGATLTGAGETALTSSPKKLCFQLGSPFRGAKGMPAAEALLSLMGKVETPENFLGARWTKLIVNGAFSPLSGMTGLTFGQIARDKYSRAIAQELFNEGAKVCRAEGVVPEKIQGRDAVGILSYRSNLKKRLSFALFPLAMKNHADIVSGIYYDLKAGRKSEAEAMSGVIVACGARRGVATPVTESVLDVVSRIERGELDVGRANLRLVGG